MSPLVYQRRYGHGAMLDPLSYARLNAFVQPPPLGIMMIVTVVHAWIWQAAQSKLCLRKVKSYNAGILVRNKHGSEPQFSQQLSRIRPFRAAVQPIEVMAWLSILPKHGHTRRLARQPAWEAACVAAQSNKYLL